MFTHRYRNLARIFCIVLDAAHLGNGNNVIGRLGENLTLEEGQKAAYNCMLNLLANLDAKTGDLNKIKRFVKVLAFVNSADSFEQQPQVVNGDPTCWSSCSVKKLACLQELPSVPIRCRAELLAR